MRAEAQCRMVFLILGKTKFDEVPKALKAKVAEILLDSGLPELVPAEFGGTMEA